MQDYDQALSLEPTNMHSLYNRGICNEKIHNYKEAIDDLTSIIRLKPDYANAYFNRGCCYEEIGQMDRAIQDYSKALDIENAQP